MTFWSWVREFQTLIAGAIGFASVIFTLEINASYAREQRQEERRHECQTLRTALIEELKINREALVRATETVNDDPKAGSYAVPSETMDDAYRTFTDRIGLLSSEEVRKVMHTYLSLRTFHASLALMGGVPLHTGARYVSVPGKSAQMLLGAQTSLIASIEEAIGVLERARDTG